MRTFDKITHFPDYTCDICKAKIAGMQIFRVSVHNITLNNTTRLFDLCLTCADTIKDLIGSEGRKPII